MADDLNLLITNSSAARLLKTAVLATAVLMGMASRAATLYWDTDGATGLQAGNGNWSEVNWSTAVAGTTVQPWTNGSDAIFETNGSSLITRRPGNHGDFDHVQRKRL